jgi:hypothetical protein
LPDKTKLTARQVLLIRGLIKGKTITDAARDAGYSEDYPRQAGSQALEQIKAKMPDILDKHGLTSDALIVKYLRPALRAKETKFFQHEGMVTDKRDVKAWGPRLTALDMAFNLAGSYATTGKNGNGAVVPIQIITNINMPNYE